MAKKSFVDDLVNDEAPEASGARSHYLQDLLKAEKRPVAPGLLLEGNDQSIPSTRSIEQYYSPEFAKLEYERMWKKTWQWACRVEEIPEIGDHVVYEIGSTSLIIVRSAPDEIKALHNVCLHRGRILRDCGGRVTQFRCPFHGITWKLNGALGNFPDRWDFGGVTDEEFKLPEAKVAIWGGFVFVNLADDPMPFDDYMIDIPEIFRTWRFDERQLMAVGSKTVASNWKVALEAFLETWHSSTTHFQVKRYYAHNQAQIDVSRERPHYSRLSAAIGVPNPALPNSTEQQVLDAMRIALDPDTRLTLPPGISAREYFAQMMREIFSAQTGRDFANVSDSEMVDFHTYFIFPNTLVFGGFAVPATLRVRPSEQNPEECVVDLSFLAFPPKGVDKVETRRHTLGPNDTFRAAGLMGEYADFGFDQDFANIPGIQRGLRAKTVKTVLLGGYLESQIRHFHGTLDSYLYGDGPLPPQRK